MRALAALLLAVALLTPHAHMHGTVRGTVTPAVRHYLGGWTRTTWFLPTGNRSADGEWPRWGTLAAPTFIPFGSIVVIPHLGTFIATDRGSAIYGNHLDIFLPWPGYRRVNDYYSGVYWLRTVG